ncbi:trimeric intracellular cation channel family protein [Parafannyhessea sp. LCP21S3_E6]|uniref:trimeric intracellular cation channel family protein n=1 Tax=unclassified Parafannyhessea TaxID=2847323 RepID=UPI003F9BAEB6
MIPELISSSGPDVTAVAIPAWLDASAVAVGSVSGVLVATDRKLDLVGFIVLAMLGGLGGGLIRDLIIQHNDVYMVNSPYAIPMTVLVGCGGFLFPSLLTRFPHLIEWVDIISVGLFVAAGSDKAIVYHMNPWAVVLMGTVTGVGGGMLRDIFLGNTPRIFQRSNFYAICAVAGSIAFYMLVIHANVTGEWATAISVTVVILMRRLSLHFNILSPANVDLAPVVKKKVRVIYHLAQEDGRENSRRILRKFEGRDGYQITYVQQSSPDDACPKPGQAHAPRTRVIDRIEIEDDVSEDVVSDASPQGIGNKRQRS